MHIDWWTLAFQTVNVLVLIWILARFFFRPVVDIVAKRQEEANKVLAEALRRVNKPPMPAPTRTRRAPRSAQSVTD